ncbi:MAG: response regulator [Desulfobacterales bacterium]|jgi:CheY-like chemotaxis protein
MRGEPLVILLVEDNPDHTELIKRTLADHRILNKIQHVSDGEEALDYMFRRGQYADPESSPRPHLVLLDLRIPKIDGLEVLTEIKNSDILKKIPVVILTSSEANSDIKAAYKSSANSYLVKPMAFDNFRQLMDDLGFYWLAWNRHPLFNKNNK